MKRYRYITKCYITGRPCDRIRKHEEEQHVFLMSPFGFPYDFLYAENTGVIWKILEKNTLKPIRADQTLRIGSIMCQSICSQINANPWMFADVSEPNPNVYYELGLAYGLGRSIILCANANVNNPYLGLFQQSENLIKYNYKHIDELICYVDSSQFKFQGATLKSRIGGDAVESDEGKREGLSFRPDSNNHSKDCSPQEFENDNNEILIFENGDGGINGVYKMIVDEIDWKLDLTDDTRQATAKSEKGRPPNMEEEWRKNAESFFKAWHTRTIALSADPSAKDSVKSQMDLFREILKCKICIVDTTVFSRNGDHRLNPYMYFALGVAHALEKDVIPITSTGHSSNSPFDVRGLWHIFFSKENELRNGFEKIIPKIMMESLKERLNAPYRMIWDRFFEEKNEFSIIYYGRAIPEDQRGKRTNIDSWDSRAVSEVYFYLARNYPTSVIKTQPPMTKLGTLDEAQIDSFREQLKKKETNYLIIGSPDNNDFAEILLADIYHKNPYGDPRENLDDGENGFIFHKDYLKKGIRSSFYYQCKKFKQKVVFPSGGNIEIHDPHTCGVLTLAINPFDEHRNCYLVLSGFTGIATWGMMRLLIKNVEIEPEDKMEMIFQKTFKEQFVTAIRQFNPDHHRSFTALVNFMVNKDDEEKIGKEGDRRRIMSAHLAYAHLESRDDRTLIPLAF